MILQNVKSFFLKKIFKYDIILVIIILISRIMSEDKRLFDTIDNSNKDLKDDLSGTIFSDFSTDNSLDIEINKLREEQEKDVFYYLGISLKVMEILFVLLFFLILVFYTYFYIQRSENFYNKNYLNPICYIFNGDISLGATGCSSITYNNLNIREEINSLYKNQLKKIFSLLPIVYEKENFLKTKEVLFLLYKSETKTKVLDILSKFDYFKNEFTGFEKKKIKCEDITINSKTRILSMRCTAFSAGYTSEIIGFSGDKNIKQDFLSGTSISIANSFINFLEKNASKYFLVINKQKNFISESVVGVDGYTNKTTFDLNLKINF